MARENKSHPLIAKHKPSTPLLLLLLSQGAKICTAKSALSIASIFPHRKQYSAGWWSIFQQGYHGCLFVFVDFVETLIGHNYPGWGLSVQFIRPAVGGNRWKIACKISTNYTQLLEVDFGERQSSDWAGVEFNLGMLFIILIISVSFVTICRSAIGGGTRQDLARTE